MEWAGSSEDMAASRDPNMSSGLNVSISASAACGPHFQGGSLHMAEERTAPSSILEANHAEGETSLSPRAIYSFNKD